MKVRKEKEQEVEKKRKKKKEKRKKEKRKKEKKEKRKKKKEKRKKKKEKRKKKKRKKKKKKEKRKKKKRKEKRRKMRKKTGCRNDKPLENVVFCPENTGEPPSNVWISRGQSAFSLFTRELSEPHGRLPFSPRRGANFFRMCIIP